MDVDVEGLGMDVAGTRKLVKTLVFLGGGFQYVVENGSMGLDTPST